MKNKFKFYFDNQGYPQADVSSPYKVLGEYLICDVQSNPRQCEELIDLVNKIENEKLDSWDGVGNGFLLVLDKKNATISYEFTDDKNSTTIPISIFKESLMGWLQLIKSK